MESFVVSARKYRPVTFDSVVGQSHITGTLKNAIRNNQLAQAFLFCGPRGVGKTTCARILAKTINCTNPTEQVEACGECRNCKSFLEGTSFSVHELDGASNNSVDDMRNLIEQVRIPPHTGKYKIYIIDEVHMLSQQAFNAFLKTLEEPPSYAIFILATTEKHKILPTILSRCQIFDFNRIKVEDMANHLANIAKIEQVNFENEALHIIAQKADGGLRDALSMFDQIVSFTERNITYESVIQNLNILDYDYYFRLTEDLFNSRTAEALLIFNEVLSKGFDGSHFIAGLAGHIRNILMAKEPKTISLLEVSEGVQAKYLAQAQKLPSSFLLSALNIANQAELQYKNSKNNRLQIELALMKICHIPVALRIQNQAAFQQNNHSRDSQQELLEKKKLTSSSVQENSLHPANVSSAAHSSHVESAKVELVPVSAPRKQVPKSEDSEDIPEEVKSKLPESNPIQTPKGEKPVKKSWSNARLGGGLDQLTGMGQVEDEEEIKPTLLQGNEFQPISPEELLKYWHEMADNYKKDNKINLFTLLIGNAPKLLEDSKVEIIIENSIQEELLIHNKFDMVNFLRVKLKNYALDIHSVFIEENSIRKPYTSAEKYQSLLAKNPLLEQLRQQFNLGLD